MPTGALDAWPASRLQTGVLYHNVKGDSHVYHDVLSCTVDHAPGTGGLDGTAVRTALASLVADRPALRTAFVVEGPRSPLQVLYAVAEIPCVLHDARDEGPAAVERWVAAERANPFDIEVPGLVRVAVHRIADRQSVVSLAYHHALLDTRSAAALTAELLSRATSADIDTVVIDDASGTHRAHLLSERAAERSDDHRRYWTDLLEGARPTEIPLPARPPGRPTTAEAEATVPVPPDLTAALRSLAADAGVPSRTVHAAAHLALLSFVSGEREVVTGLVAATPPGTPGARATDPVTPPGFFVNIVPCRLDVGRRTWRELIRAVAAAEQAAQPHHRYPFALIEADTGARICPTEFSHTELPPLDPPPATGLRITDVRLHERTDYFQLLVSVLEEPAAGRTRVTLHHPPAVIPREQAERYAALYGRLLRHAVTAPGEPVVDALARWAGEHGLTAVAAAGETTAGATVPVLARVVARLRAATDTGAGPLTHSADAPGSGPATASGPDIVQEFREPATVHRETAHQLAARVTRTRHALLAMGAGPGTRIACFLERGPDPLVALLAVWSVGASYVPVDPTLPPARRRAQLALVGCAAALRSPGIDPGPLAWDGPEAVLTGVDAETPGTPDPELDLGSWTLADPESEAYVLFTSGSTGEPKAVNMPHRSIANLVSWQLTEPEFARPRRMSQFAALSFDVSVQELACAAASGSTLVTVPDDVRRNPQELLSFLDRERIEVAFLPVVALSQLALAHKAFGVTPGRLRYVVTAGEALVVTDAVRGFCAATGAEVINQYGPTETHVVLRHRLGPDPAAWPDRPPVGHALPNTTAHVLDPLGRPVALGTPGELSVGGAAVALGYAAATGLDPRTRQRFLPGPATGALTYRTGDIVRVREEDGAVEFVGRADEQTKIRGHRVEPAEVATVLLRHPGVRHCVVRALPLGDSGLDLVAYVEPVAPDAGTGGPTPDELREHARAALPEYAVPAHVEILGRMPVTRNGKIDSRALPAPARPAPAASREPVGAVEARVLRAWEEVLGRPVTSPHTTFFAAGGNSLQLMRLYLALRRAFDVDFPVHELFRHTTAAAFAGLLGELRAEPGAVPVAEAPLTATARVPAPRTAGSTPQSPAVRPTDIAVIGMACRFPGAPDIDAFRRLIDEGTDTVTFFTDDELRAAQVPDALRADPSYIPAGRPLEHPGAFDAEFFGISPREAELTDPQARIFLELCWLALEDGGYDPARHPGDIGVFATAARPTYFRDHVLPTLGAAARQDGSVLGLQADIGNLGDYLATRVSHRLGLRGPALSAQSACSSGLVVVHLAVQSLLAGESDMALAGGVAVNTRHGRGYLYEEGSITSPDGHCRPFDASAAGTVFGDGGGVVLLKRLTDALADGDRVVAVIKGTAVNNDGADKMAYSAPSAGGQARAIARAHRVAGVDPRTIGYVEAHGTGTPLGDPIEIAGLTTAFGLGPVERPFCAVGSVKAQIGHLTTAAGTAGLIKALLAVADGRIPRAVHLDEPGPHLPLTGSPFHFPRASRPWPGGPDNPRRAGVSSFGLGGTNAHAVIEQAPEVLGMSEIPETSETSEVPEMSETAGLPEIPGTAGLRAIPETPEASASPVSPLSPVSLMSLEGPASASASASADELYILSARTPTALDAQRTRLATHLRAHDPLPPASVAHTLARGRAVLPYRLAVAAGTTGEAAARLTAAILPMTPAPGPDLPVILAFPGQGSQYEGMGSALYKGDPAFRAEVDRCAAVIRSLTGQDIREIMFGAVPGRPADARPDASWETRWIQLALFTLEYAVARALTAAGIVPAALLGHSVGEYVAACLAGVFPLEDALRIVEARGRLMGSTGPGAMTAVALGEAELRAVLPPALDIAALNAPGRCVVAGPPAAVDHFEAELAAAGTPFTRLRTAHAFHSRLMDPVLDEFRDVVATARREPATLRVAANATGTWADPDALADPGHWVRQTRAAVRFADCLAAVAADLGPAVLLEAGPGHGLGDMARRTVQHGTAEGGPQVALSVLSPWGSPADSASSVLDVVGGLWTRGARVDWDVRFVGRAPRRVPLPGYPFERRTHWIEPLPPVTPSVTPSVTDEANADRTAPAPRGWLQIPRWTPAPRPAQPTPGRARRVLALVPPGLPDIADTLKDRGHQVVTVVWDPPEPMNPSPTETPAAIRPHNTADLERLLAALRSGPPFDTVVCAWGLTPAAPGSELAARAEALTASLLPLLRTVATAAQRDRSTPLDVLVLTRGRHRTGPADSGDARPELALLDGAAKVIPHEYPHVRLAEVDLDPATDTGASVAAELDALTPNTVVALRADTRLTLGHEPATTATDSGAALWTDGGTYLITGGLGGIGLALAEDAARTAQGVRIVLTHRAPLPPRDIWRTRATDPATPPRTRARLAALARIEASGASVECVRADVCDEDAMRRVRADHGPFDGIAHCAGVPGGRLVEAMDEEHLRRVLAPKVDGTLVLDRAVADDHTRWLVLCSSMVAIFGGLGQADYTGASAFLDAFAQWRTARGRHTLSLDFDAWSESGMAVDAAHGATGGHEPEGVPLPDPGPVFTHTHPDTASSSSPSTEYRGTLAPDDDTAWLVRDHRVGDDGLLPGSAAVEFLYAAGARQLGTERLELLGVDILAPLTVPAGTPVEFAVRLDEPTSAPNPDPDPGPVLEATLRARPAAGGPWTTHAQARVRPLPPTSPAPMAPPPDHPGPITDVPGTALRSGVLTFGPRWQNIRHTTRTGPREALLTCALDARFAPDTERFALHPALLDNAAGEPFWDGDHDDHLPLSYERIAVHGRLGPRVHGRIRGHDDPATGTVRIDSLITDDEGRVLVEIDGYRLRRAPRTAPAASNVRLVSTEPGDLRSLQFVPGERVAPGPGEIEVDVRATGLNFKEVLSAAGMLDTETADPGGATSHAYGLEAAGTVTALGPGTTGVSVGDRVMVMGAECFSRHITLPARLAHPVPDGMSFAEAAALPVAYTTAYDCLVRRAGLRRGERVLIHAATGGVGLAAVHIARRVGAEILATAGSPDKRAHLTGLGVTTVMDSRTLAFERETTEAGGVDVVLNSLGGERIAAGLRTLRPDGRFIEIGRRDVAAGTALDLRLLERGVTFSVYYPDLLGASLADGWAEVAGLLRTGELPALPVRTFAEGAVGEAFQYMAGARHIGKIVVTRPGADETEPAATGGLIPLDDGITNATGTRAVREALALGLPQVLVSRRGTATREADFLVAEQVLSHRPSATARHRPELPYAYTAPTGTTEAALAAIWSELLGLDNVGREDRFTDLGGDSLTATQIVAAIRKRYGVRVSPADILDGRPLSALAELVDAEHVPTG
ncbi:amino acid adenylation domain-containing protein [Streptomyces sp. NPDC048290]|uniref:non-ribosomal peptide synthetase/type I polyketide synthase n=1 Tax=Streptomyces sp. NPDC048290 TaxID=3155811 RepID=UPI003443DDFB